MQVHEVLPFVADPPRVQYLVTEPRGFCDRSALAAAALLPRPAVEEVIAERTELARLEALLSKQHGTTAAGPGDEMDLALFAGLEDAEVLVQLGWHEPV